MSEFRITEPGEYITRGGEKVIVKMTDWPGQSSVIGHFPGSSLIYKWGSDGLVHGTPLTHIDIVAKYVPMVEREGWVNIYEDPCLPGKRVTGMSSIYPTKDLAASAGRSPIATAHITWKEPAE